MPAKNELAADLLAGRLVRLTCEKSEEMGRLFSRWAQDSEYMRLMEGTELIPYTARASRKFIEKELQGQEWNAFFFSIRTLAEDRIIGNAELEDIRWNHGDAFVGIGLGERETWGRGYGTDAMNVLLRYAFTELNLHRVSLGVFEYNPRAMRSYEKSGFRVEGRLREFVNREGRRWDMIIMGILREEWLEANGYPV